MRLLEGYLRDGSHSWKLVYEFWIDLCRCGRITGRLALDVMMRLLIDELRLVVRVYLLAMVDVVAAGFRHSIGDALARYDRQ